MQLLEHFKDLTVHPKNAEELKGLILQLAVQGKLTKKWREQNPDVEPAAVLLEKIQEEKAQLIKEKKIKKEKNFPAIKNGLFTLPSNWEWSNLGKVTTASTGYAFKSKDYKEEGVFISRVTNIQENGQINKDKAVFIDENEANSTYSKFALENEDVILVMVGGSLGKIGKVDSTILPAVLNQNQWKFSKYGKMDSDFLIHLLKFVNRTQIKITKSTHGHLGQGEYLSLIVPIPPLEEQKAIVDIVNQLFREVEALEEQTKARVQLKEDFVTSALQQLTTGDTTAQWSFLQDHFKTFFTEKTGVKKLRESILQLAVQGKLTSNWRKNHPINCSPVLGELPAGLRGKTNGADNLPPPAPPKTGGEYIEHASVLLEKIKAEKAQLIKDKKIKKEKPLPEITEDEIPYELPEGWTWCRVGEVTSVRVGATPSRDNQDYWNGNINWVSSGEVANNFVFETKEKITEKALSESSVSIYPEGTVLVAMIGQGKTRGQTSILKIAAGTNQNVGGMIIFHDYLVSEYLWQYFLGRYEKTRSNAAGGNQPAINGTKLKMSVIGFPPLEEQKAIVAKVNALMGLCDSLEQEIENSTKLVEDLMQSCVKEVFEG